MAETLRFNKGDIASKKPKEIEETKPSEPQNRFSITDFNNQSKNQRSEDTKPKRGKGRPRKNKSTKSIRISDEAVDIINAYKQITDQETQDDAVIDAFRKAINDKEITDDKKKVFDLLLEVKGVKDFFYRNESRND